MENVKTEFMYDNIEFDFIKQVDGVRLYTNSDYYAIITNSKNEILFKILAKKEQEFVHLDIV